MTGLSLIISFSELLIPLFVEFWLFELVGVEACTFDGLELLSTFIWLFVIADMWDGIFEGCCVFGKCFSIKKNKYKH